MADTFEEANIQAILQNIAKKYGYKQPIFSIDHGAQPGENFICRIYRVAITEVGSAEAMSLIFKVSPTNRNVQQKLSSEWRFKTESDVYQVILPELNNLLQKYGIANQPTFPGTAACLGVELDTTNSVVILEDLKPLGFGIVDIKTGLDENHCRLVVEKLAVFHSASMALQVLQPETAKRFRKMLEITTWRDAISGELLDNFHRAFFTGTSLLQDPYKKGNPTFDKLCNIYKNFGEEFRKLNDTPGDVACIAHGDCWSNNLLFKYDDDGKPTDLRIVDFQTPGYNSPVIDIVLVLLECTAKETRDKHYQNLLQYYFDEVTKNLRLMDTNPQELFPWSTFQQHLLKYGRIAVVWSLVGLPTHLAEKAKDKIDFDGNLFSDTVEVKEFEATDKLKKRLTDIVADAERWGYL